MKINFNKKIIIGITILFILFGFAIAKFIYFNGHYKTFVGKRISFLYPREIIFEDLNVSSNGFYNQYRIRREYRSGPNGSYIWIGEPLKNNDKQKKLSDNTRPEFIPLIKPIVVNGLKGKSVTYHLDEQLPGDQPVQADITQIYLSNPEYSNTPITLSYSRSDVDNSLDKTWKLILRTLKY